MVKRTGLISREQVLQAALRCFKKYGIERTRIIDVADEASISRQSIYRLFATREELLEQIAADRILALGAKLTVHFEKYETLTEALIEGSIRSVKLGQRDSLLSDLVTRVDTHSFDQFMFGGTPEVHQHMLGLWGPILDRARASGELRKGISNEHAVEWIRNVHALVSLRDDYDEEKQRRVLMDFLVPSLVRDAA